MGSTTKTIILNDLYTQFAILSMENSFTWRKSNSVLGSMAENYNLYRGIEFDNVTM
jgi:hypothetical protein